MEKGEWASSSAFPLSAHHFAFHKSGFRYALCLRYGWNPPLLYMWQNLQRSTCPHDGFPSIRHNELRDITASAEVRHNVGNESEVSPKRQMRYVQRIRRGTSNTSDEVRPTRQMRYIQHVRRGTSNVSDEVRPTCQRYVQHVRQGTSNTSDEVRPTRQRYTQHVRRGTSNSSDEVRLDIVADNF